MLSSDSQQLQFQTLDDRGPDILLDQGDEMNLFGDEFGMQDDFGPVDQIMFQPGDIDFRQPVNGKIYDRWKGLNFSRKALSISQ